MLHGNGGQAEDRIYAIPSFSADDAVYILEYPGYGKRPGRPSREAFDAAALEAYLLLRKTYPDRPVCVVGESIGSGPAASLATRDHPPEKFVFIVPFDRLSLVAKDHFPAMLVDLILSDDWDNAASLSRYKGPVDIFGAAADSIIPVGHAQALAARLPRSRFVLIEGGHNDWPEQGRVRIRNP
jgi:pimeloyl-ACP methyl ester carboxylesterase